MVSQEELDPAEADGLESEGDSSASDSEMDEAAQIAQAQAMAAAVKARPLANEGMLVFCSFSRLGKWNCRPTG